MGVLLNIVKLTPSILSAVISVESVIGTAGAGDTKKQIVLAGIQAAAQAGETVDNTTISAVSSLIDKLVAVLNASKLFGFGK